MARRYGAAFSPDKSAAASGPAKDGPRDTPDGAPSAPVPNAFSGQPVARARARVNLLFLAPLPLLFTALPAGATGMAVDLAAFAVLELAAWLLRDGLRAEDAFNARAVARRPAIPRKIFASVLTGAGVALAAWTPGGAVGAALIYGVIGAVLHLFSFGIDPLRSKGVSGVDGFANDRVARAVEEAEQHLGTMRAAVARLHDRDLDARLERFQSVAREMFRTIEQDPRDLTAARRYLGIYLIGARDAATKFADLYTATRNPGDRGDFTALLTDLETNFRAKTTRLLANDRTEMEVEIEVLRERLAREGIAPGQ